MIHSKKIETFCGPKTAWVLFTLITMAMQFLFDGRCGQAKGRGLNGNPGYRLKSRLPVRDIKGFDLPAVRIR